jgi:nucleoside-diphosphate-sugar epimerase
MRVLVTGASGLIGAHATADLLERGHGVRAFVRTPDKLERALAPFGRGISDLEVATGDVCDKESVEHALVGCQGLLHCAGVFSPDLSDAERLRSINVTGTGAVLGAGSRAGLDRMVFISSMLALFPPAGPVFEATGDVGQPRSMYAATKAAADHVARSLQSVGAPLSIVYPAAVQGPDDPTFSTGPQLVANALREGRVLVTEGGLPYTDVRDLARVLSVLFEIENPPRRLMGPAFFVPHERYHELLCELTGRSLAARRIPGWLVRGLGRLGDLAQKLGRPVELTSEAAAVLTRSVPVDDAEARRLLGREALDEEASFRDLIVWMHGAGLLDAEQVGALAGEG